MTTAPSSTSSSPPKPGPIPLPLRPPDDLAAGLGSFLGCPVELGEARYILERLIGAGGMGEVYQAVRVEQQGRIDWRTSELVAVKVVRGDLAGVIGADAKPFLDEAHLHLCLDHPNVVRLHGIVEQEGILYLVMEYLEGRDLRSLLKLAKRTGRRLTDVTICNVLAQVADALDYVHRAMDADGRLLHIVHRDISPSNIRVLTTGVVKLMDFGVAWSTLEGRLETRSSFSGFQGKLKYLSPEQVNHLPLDGRSDLFALGCILVETLTGRNPFDVGHEILVLQAIQNVSPEAVEQAIKDLPEGLKVICHRLLARGREDRYATGKEVADALRAYALAQGDPLGSAPVAREIAALERLPPEVPPAAAAKPQPDPVLSLHPGNLTRRVALAAAATLILTVIAVEAAKRIPMSTPFNGSLSKSPLAPVASACVAGLIAAAGCQAHIATHTRTGDCAVAPVREVEGMPLPDFLPARFFSLNGQQCRGEESATGRDEPCPVGDGEFILHVQDGDSDFFGALLVGKAHVVPGPETVRVIANNNKPRQAIGRTMALFTELRFKGRSYPICGVLYDADDRKVRDPDKELGNEGAPIWDTARDVSSGPSGSMLGYGQVKLFGSK